MELTPQEIAPGVLVVTTSTADGRVGVIAGDDIALAVDAGIDEAEGQAVLSAARSLGRRQVQLVYTHAHVDHALGGIAFGGHDIIASPAIAEHMAEQTDAWAARLDEPRARLEARLGWPTSLFDSGGEIDLGGRRVTLLDTPGHAPGALCVLDPEAGILFGGDTVVTAIPPFFRDGDSAVMEASLRDLAGLDIDILIPGHGDVVRSRSACRAAILWSADYLARCRAHVVSRYGGDHDEIVAAASYEEFIGNHLPRDRHRMRWRHEMTIRLMLAEADRRPTEN